MQPVMREKENKATACGPDMMDQAAFEEALRRGLSYDRIKRVLDALISALAIIALSPVFLVISLAIMLDDPQGGPFYASRRIGKDGRSFRFFKFRSMCMGADEQLDSLLERNEADGPAFKIRKDPRITRVGRILRKYSLDELPQLVNVFLGDMSIVGPRPPLPREVVMYTPEQMRRLAIRPGLTCYWQVQPRRNDLSFEKWLELDMKYIRERSLMVDIELILRTVGVVFIGEGV